MKGLKRDEKVNLLKAQLKFRKNVLEQKVTDPKLYSFSVVEEQLDGSKKRRLLSPEELAENVKKIIQESTDGESVEEDPGITPLVTKHVVHKFETDEGFKWYKGRVVSQVSNFFVHLPSFFIFTCTVQRSKTCTAL